MLWYAPLVRFHSNFRVENPAVNPVDLVSYIPLIGLFKPHYRMFHMNLHVGIRVRHIFIWHIVVYIYASFYASLMFIIINIFMKKTNCPESVTFRKCLARIDNKPISIGSNDSLHKWKIIRYIWLHRRIQRSRLSLKKKTFFLEKGLAGEFSLGFVFAGIAKDTCTELQQAAWWWNSENVCIIYASYQLVFISNANSALNQHCERKSGAPCLELIVPE